MQDARGQPACGLIVATRHRPLPTLLHRGDLTVSALKLMVGISKVLQFSGVLVGEIGRAIRVIGRVFLTIILRIWVSGDSRVRLRSSYEAQMVAQPMQPIGNCADKTTRWVALAVADLRLRRVSRGRAVPT